MDYKILSGVYAELEGTSSILRKTDILAELFSKTPKNKLRIVTYLVRGEVFPSWVQRELNMADKMAISAIARVSGSSRAEIENMLKKKGDLGSAATALLSLRKQAVLFKEPLTLDKVYGSFERISTTEGEGSVEKKIALLSELLSNATLEEAKYIIRTVLGQLRIGVGEGVVRDAIAKAFDAPRKQVEKAFAVLNDYGEVAELALRGVEGLKDTRLRFGRPLKVMLYPKADTTDEAVEKIGLPLQAEFKYDGFRTQIHKNEKKVVIFSRNLDNVTERFPDVVEQVLRNVKARVAILDSETVGIDPETGHQIPFQKISQRIRRKYDIGKMAEKIPVETNVFDILLLDENNLIDLPLKKRLELLKGIIRETDRFKLVDYITAKEPGELGDFYEKSLGEGAEGLILKNLDSPYKPGQRVGYGFKLKPETETLDLVVLGAEWGEGRRANWLSSYLLGARDPATGTFMAIGKMATGMTESDLQSMTEMFKPLIKSERGKVVKIQPKIVIEVGYQEIQKSPNYASGYALRFPRMVRLRDDKSSEDADTVERVEYLYKGQFKRPGSR